jgi:hypothetical protein
MFPEKWKTGSWSKKSKTDTGNSAAAPGGDVTQWWVYDEHRSSCMYSKEGQSHDEPVSVGDEAVVTGWRGNDGVPGSP